MPDYGPMCTVMHEVGTWSESTTQVNNIALVSVISISDDVGLRARQRRRKLSGVDRQQLTAPRDAK